MADGGQQVYLQGYAKDGNCYTIAQSNDPSIAPGSFTGYEETTGACAVPTGNAAAPSTGTFSVGGGFFTTAW